MQDNWDDDVNIGTLTQYEQMVRNNELYNRRREQARAARGIIEVPWLTELEVHNNFSSLAREVRNEHNDGVAPWTANRLMYICHDCGSFGVKVTAYELTKCSAWSCRSRNITICRSGELSMLIRGLLHRYPGVRMPEVFSARQARIREARAARRRL